MKNGVYDIKYHPWFKEINWKDVYEKRIEPIYKPYCKSVADTSNFEMCEEETLKVAASELFADEFKKF